MSAERPARGRLARALRIAGVNAALILGGLALVAVAGEAWLRLTSPFFDPASPSRFVPGVGVLYEPGAEIRHTNDLDFREVSRANSLGFVDREPPDPASAAASCHVAVIGDSFVAAREVAIADKAHVRLEALATARAPGLGVTASAYGYHGTGQVNQLPYYDEYARRLSPNLVVLVLHGSDLLDNSLVAMALKRGWDPDRPPFAFAVRTEDGGVGLRPPHPAYAEHARPWADGPEAAALPERWREAAVRALTGRSLFARWLDAKRRALFPDARTDRPPLRERMETLSRQPGYEWILEGWYPPEDIMMNLLLSEDPPPVFVQAREFSIWSLAEFRRRAERDGAALVVLTASTADDRPTALQSDMADGLGIPVVSLHDHVARANGRIEDARWPHDHHWSPQGHLWAAEAILDWLSRHPEVCEDAP